MLKNCISDADSLMEQHYIIQTFSKLYLTLILHNDCKKLKSVIALAFRHSKKEIRDGIIMSYKLCMGNTKYSSEGLS